ncbi:MAG: hypothetical protein IH991_22515 [Planctomycetes bacterium]|nr:hypothetical protein [Planctomycetota bacterium]
MTISPLIPLIPLAAPVLNLAASAMKRMGQHVPFADFLANTVHGESSSLATAPAKGIELPPHLAEQFDKFARDFRAQLEAAGIDTSQPIELRSDGVQLVVDNDHPQRIEIEKLLVDSPQISSLFQQIVEQFAALSGGFDGLHDVVVIDEHGARFKID